MQCFEPKCKQTISRFGGSYFYLNLSRCYLVTNVAMYTWQNQSLDQS